MAVPAMIMSAAGGVVGAMGKLQAASSESSAYQYQAGVARMNEQIAKQNADYARKVGEVEAQVSGIKTGEAIGSTKAAQSGSGVSVGSGSAAGVRASQAEVGEFDQAMIRNNAARKAYGYEVEAAGDEAKAQMDEFAAKNVKDAGMLGAFTSLLSGASSVASKWMQYKPAFGDA